MAKLCEISAKEVASVPMMKATEMVRDIVTDYCEIHPEREEHVGRCWWRVVQRIFYEDREGKETMRRPRSPGKRAKAPQHESMSLQEAMAEVERVVDQWIRGEGWEDKIDAEAQRDARLAWQRVVLRCRYEDEQSKKRLAEAKAKGIVKS
jgi:predicted GNAT family acetyltransferase